MEKKIENKKWVEMYAEQGAVNCLTADLIVISARTRQKELDYAPKDQLFYSSQKKYVGAYTKDALAEETEHGSKFWTSDDRFKSFIGLAAQHLITNEEIFNKYINSSEVVPSAYELVTKNLTDTTGVYLLTQPQRQEDLETKLKKELRKKVGESFIEVYQEITQSEKLSSLQLEKLAFYDIVNKIQKRFGWGISLPDALNSDQAMQEELNKLLNKYAHIAIGGFSNDWRTIKYYEDLFSQLKEKSEHFENEHNQLQNYRQEVLARKSKHVKQCMLSEGSKKIAERLAEIGYLRLELHYSYDHLHYLVNKILQNAAKAFGVDESIFFYQTNNEVLQSLNNGSITHDVMSEAERRKQSYLYLIENNKYTLYPSTEADIRFNFLMPAEDYSDIRELRGQGAYRGQLKGVVRVFTFTGDTPELQQQMRDFQDGEVLVASQTSPILMPAILKAVAIITDEGGITAHAAIVARELKKPCIVGTKIATKALQTGDVVEIDANTGIVKILK